MAYTKLQQAALIGFLAAKRLHVHPYAVLIHGVAACWKCVSHFEIFVVVAVVGVVRGMVELFVTFVAA